MRSSVSAVHDLVGRIAPADDLERRHRSQTLRWLESTDDVFRRVKPATPAQHLVSYVVPVDPATGDILLVDHINAGLWLPPGGHVEPDEHPEHTAAREAAEELGVAADAADLAGQPAFVTVTRTVGIDSGHTDVSLWFVLHLDRERQLTVDETEFRAARWWSRAELSAADPTGFDPHFTRFVAKIDY
ncbi:NUDIX hydrolase [Micromonospora sp. NBC_01813]|uniref:NUDIX hydrolase n=1 Tax=Micromonospora sp. NBC_01813 TaxID=2975988 RepID=UPI002DD85075|nr:NUDIX hydrolase [Micromonospora sp. NBC_01813]WSA06170.1 NUDIX hydrolase [Micromonospora sp. NBC_01813]